MDSRLQDLSVKCSKCGCELEHVCNANLREEVKRLLKWRPESGFPKGVDNEGDDRVNSPYTPFITESFLYPLLGKGDARTLVAFLRGVVEAAGLDMRALQKEVWAELDKEEAEAKRVAEARAQRRAAAGR